jgi:transposase InsO family protein
MIKLGPFAGVPTLRAEFKQVPHQFLARMKRRLVRVMKRRWRWYLRRLLWLRAGAVWAVDFTKPKARLWGGNRMIFLVRDLASGAQLAAVACKGERAQVACSVLLSLIALYGAPLVLKKDNGPAFRSKALQEVLEAHGITPLDSPPYTPQYNGACERSGGNFKKRVAHVAASYGRANDWLPQDLEEALLVANTRSRPFGAKGPTPAEALEARDEISAEERRAFQAAVTSGTESALETFKAKNGRIPTCAERAAIDRKATQDALCENGYLQFRKGRLSTLISAWKARRNS